MFLLIYISQFTGIQLYCKLLLKNAFYIYWYIILTIPFRYNIILIGDQRLDNVFVCLLFSSEKVQ